MNQYNSTNNYQNQNLNNEPSEKLEEFIGNTQNIHYSAVSNQYIIEKVDVVGKSFINIPDGKILLITDEVGNIIGITTGNFDIQNSNNNHYYISLLEHFVNIKGNIENDTCSYNYNFRVNFRIVDPVKILEKIQIIDSMRITEFFKSIFDEILKNNLNKFIIDYVDEKNISLDELSSSTVDNYLFSKIQSKIEDEYNGVELVKIQK